MLALIASDHADGLANDVEVEVLEVVVWCEGEVLIDVVLIPSPKTAVYVTFVPSYFFYTLEACVYRLKDLNYIICVRFFWPEELRIRHIY